MDKDIKIDLSAFDILASQPYDRNKEKVYAAHLILTKVCNCFSSFDRMLDSEYKTWKMVEEAKDKLKGVLENMA